MKCSCFRPWLVHVGMFTDLLAQLYTLSYQNKCKILTCVKTKCAFTYSIARGT